MEKGAVAIRARWTAAEPVHDFSGRGQKERKRINPGKIIGCNKPLLTVREDSDIEGLIARRRALQGRTVELGFSVPTPPFPATKLMREASASETIADPTGGNLVPKI